MEQIPKSEAPKQEDSMLQEITVGEMAKYLAEHPLDQLEIFGAHLSEEEISGRMTSSVVVKAAEKMGLRAVTLEEMKAVLKSKSPPEVESSEPPVLVWDAEEQKMRPYDAMKDGKADEWKPNHRLFIRDSE